MARFVGPIGIFTGTTEKIPGVFVEVIEEKVYKGDVLHNSKSWDKSGGLNDNLTIHNRISVVADAYAYANISAMRYVKWNGVSWRISSLQISRPRIILTLGEVYNAV